MQINLSLLSALTLTACLPCCLGCEGKKMASAHQHHPQNISLVFVLLIVVACQQQQKDSLSASTSSSAHILSELLLSLSLSSSLLFFLVSDNINKPAIIGSHLQHHLVRTVVGDIINITLTTAVNLVLKVFTTISVLVISTITNAAMVVDCFGKNIINIIARHL